MTDRKDFAAQQDPEEGNTSTTFGHDHSHTQVNDQEAAQSPQEERNNSAMWAEYDPNALPQVVFSDAPEAVVNVNIEADVEAPISAEHKAALIVPPKPWHEKWKDHLFSSGPPGTDKPWYKNWRIWCVTAVLAIFVAGIVPAVVLTRPSLNGEDSRPTTASPTASTMTDSGPTASTPSGTTSPIPECDPSDFVPRASWLGSYPPGWDFDMSPANDAVDCCRQCFEDTDSQCNGWLFMPNDNNGMPPCNRIINFEGQNVDDNCPNGKPDIVFTRGSGSSVEDNFGGRGPCTGRVRS